MTTLVHTVERLLCSMNQCERVDDLLDRTHLPGKKRADYLVSGRSIIVEQKILRNNPVEKPQNYINELVDRGDFVIYGNVNTHEIFAKHPNGHNYQRKLVQRIVNAVTGDLEHADKQTRDTRDIFSIPDAVGIVLLINTGAPMLDLELVGYATNLIFSKTTDTGRRQYDNNAAVLFISAFECIPSPIGEIPLPILIKNQNDDLANDRLCSFFNHFSRAWLNQHKTSKQAR